MHLREEIERRVVYLTDRKALFQWLNRQHQQWVKLQSQATTSEEQKDTTEDKSFHLIDDFLLQSKEAFFPEQIDDLLPPVAEAAPADYTQTLLDQPDISSSPSTTDAIIDQFIEQDAVQAITRPVAEIAAEQTEAFKPESNAESLLRHDAFLTESLAKIYIKQKKYAKALEIIKKLSLKYPEKNVYFADQIRFLETIITNIKTE